MAVARDYVYDSAGRYTGYKGYNPKGVSPPKEPVRELITVVLVQDFSDYLDRVKVSELGGKVTKMLKDFSDEERRGAYFSSAKKSYENEYVLNIVTEREENDKEFNAKIAAYNIALEKFNSLASERAAIQLARACEQEATDRALYEELKKKFGNE